MIYATNQPSYAQSFPLSPLFSSPRLFSTFLPDIQQFQLVEERPRRPSRLSGEVGPFSLWPRTSLRKRRKSLLALQLYKSNACTFSRAISRLEFFNVTWKFRYPRATYVGWLFNDDIDRREWASTWMFSRIFSDKISAKLSNTYLASITRFLAIILDGSHLVD